MNKTEDLAMQISATLADSPLGLDEKIKALGMARSTLTRGAQSADLDAWRAARVRQGMVGTGKKTQALQASKDALKNKSKGKKD